eukprot:6205489-Pleurochrysis_carterae.AAC.2
MKSKERHNACARQFSLHSVSDTKPRSTHRADAPRLVIPPVRIGLNIDIENALGNEAVALYFSPRSTWKLRQILSPFGKTSLKGINTAIAIQTTCWHNSSSQTSIATEIGTSFAVDLNVPLDRFVFTFIASEYDLVFSTALLSFAKSFELDLLTTSSERISVRPRHQAPIRKSFTFEAALHTIQDKYVFQDDHLSGLDPGASHAHPQGTAPAGTRSKANTLAGDKYIESERAYNLRSKMLLAIIRGHATDLAILQVTDTTAIGNVKFHGLSCKTT